VAFVLLACPGLEVALPHPLAGVGAERDFADLRVEPVAAHHLGFGGDKPAFGVPLGFERVRRQPADAVPA
jgi:hypothetical protein